MKSINEQISITSKSLDREVIIEIFIPVNYEQEARYPLLILNDGQDMHTMEMTRILNDMWTNAICRPFVLIAPHAHNRMHEYGVAGKPDFKNRGNQAEQYSDFILKELLPAIKKKLSTVHFESHAIAGFSLGGLSAFDIAWRNPDVFQKIGAFSGSFWWRKKDLKDGYTDADRIMHEQVRSAHSKPPLQLWLQCGTLDEKADRNQNGIIDSIDDTMDLVRELQSVGFRLHEDVFFELTVGGKHTLETYGMMIPLFLRWAFPVR